MINRTQRTKVGSAISDEVYLTSGVVQGSCIGPLLFVLYINDVVQVIRGGCRGKIYVDDLKIYTEIESSHDEKMLQDSLDALTRWSNDWQLTISTKKCVILNVHHKPSASHPRDYMLAACVVPTQNSVKDLGVIVDADLKFRLHINNIVARAHSRASLIHKCFVSGDLSAAGLYHLRASIVGILVTSLVATFTN